MAKPPPQLVQRPEPPFRRMARGAYFAASKISRAVVIQFVICLLITALHAGLFLSPVSERFQNFFSDYFFRLRRHTQDDPRIVLIEIAEDSIQGIGRWPWPRHYHAVMTHLLNEFGAKAIVFDMLFSEPSTPFDDGAFVQALQEKKNVYMPVVYETKGKEKIWIHNLPDIEKNIQGTGHINIQPDRDGTLRRIQPFISDARETHPHLALQVAYDFLRQKLPSPEKPDLPLDPSGSLMINWTGKWQETFRHYSYLDLLKSYESFTRGEKPAIGPEKIKDKICIIGLTAFGHTDIKANPMEPAYPAVGIHANVINSILTRDFIRPVLKTWNFFALAGIGILVSVLFTRFRQATSFILGLSFGAVWIAFAFFLFKKYGILIEVAAPLLIILSLYVFCTAFALILSRKERAKLLHLATRDGLTGLYVIRHFRQLMNEAVPEAQKKKIPLSLILLDIDHFKQINDTYGHPAGDMVLKQIAQIISSHMRKKIKDEELDYAGRYGGEEFILLLCDCKFTEAFYKVAERLRKKVEESEFLWQEKKIHATISLGVASLRPGENFPDLMVHRADEALYRAKQEGRNRTCLERSEAPL